MTLDGRQPGRLHTVDVKMKIPELDDIGPFWMRGYAAHRTFAELYQEGVNHPEVLRSRKSLARVQASRHFWCGDRMMLRAQSVATALPKGAAPEGGTEISLVLRPDYYRVVPPQYVRGGTGYLYLDAEATIDHLISRILSREERPCCFDLCSVQKRRLDRRKSLADYELFPAWEDAAETFPDRAELILRPRASWGPHVLLAATAVLGAAIGYMLLSSLLRLR